MDTCTYPAKSGDHGHHAPRGPTVVLGLVTTKVPELETRDGLLRRIDEAARYVPLAQLALSLVPKLLIAARRSSGSFPQLMSSRTDLVFN